jgi:hypothetical protein
LSGLGGVVSLTTLSGVFLVSFAASGIESLLNGRSQSGHITWDNFLIVVKSS